MFYFNLKIIKIVFNNIIYNKNKVDMLSFNIYGGLGNQLFKIISALGFNEKYNKKLILLKNNIYQNSHESKEQTITNIKTLLPEMNIVDDLDIRDYYKYKEESAFVYTNINIDIDNTKDILLDGYFINEKYFPESCPVSIINAINSIETTNTLKYKTITHNFEHTYFIHIRLGDYVNSDIYDINLLEYYKYCINKIKDQNSLAQFIICTNEHGHNLDKYITHFPKGIDYIIQDLNNTALDTLYIMSLCKGGITSNSTLSWMGLYLQKEIQKQSLKSENKNNVNNHTHTHKDYMFIPYPWVKYVRDFNADNTKDIYPKWAQIYDTINNKLIFTPLDI
jgi:hypothetical protein